MSGFLEKNLTVLKGDGYPLKDWNHISLSPSRSGQPVPSLSWEGRSYPLHSLIDPRREGEKLLRTYRPAGMKIFLGLGGGYQIEPFAGVGKILIIEPDREMAGGLLSKMDFTGLLSRRNVTLLISPEGEEIIQWLLDNYHPLLDGSLDVLPLRPWQEKRKERFDLCSGAIQRALEHIGADCSTQKRLGRQWQRNIIATAEEAAAHQFRPCHISPYSDIIIAAAGPGLEEHIPLMAERSPETLLLAVDTALPALMKMGLHPQAVLTIDPQSVGYLHFMERLPSDCLLIADWGSPVPRLELNHEILYIRSPHPLCRYLSSRGDFTLLPLTAGGNVTQTALSLAEACGLKRVTLLGADFSYPRGKPYCRGSYFTEWHYLKSDRLDPHLNRLLSFVLEKSRRYESPLLRSYEESLLRYLKEKSARVVREDGGRWEIEFPEVCPDPPPDGIPFPAVRDILKGYADELDGLISRREWNDTPPTPLLMTLLPLGYAFLEQNGPEALEKAARYTIKLISERFS